MDIRGQSHCPLCRHPYGHFPAVCQMLHILLKKMYPSSHGRRKRQTLEDEEEQQNLFESSPDVDRLVNGEELNHLSIVDQPSDFSCEDNLSKHPSTEEKTSNDGSSAGNCKQVTVADVLCSMQATAIPACCSQLWSWYAYCHSSGFCVVMDVDFRPNEGYLYFMIGNGGGTTDPQNFAQKKKSLLDKITRLDIDNIPTIVALKEELLEFKKRSKQF